MTEHSALGWNVGGHAPTDETQLLIERCLSGEQSAYVTLYDQYSGVIYRLAYSLLQHQEDAEEVLQDSFEYAFRRLEQYDARKSAFKTWLYRIAVSRCHNKRRRKWLPSLSLQQMDDGAEASDPTAPLPDERAALNEQQQAVWRAVRELSPKLREVAVLRYYGGLQYGEIGEVLDIPPKTAESRMRLAHKALREQLRELL